MNAPPQIYTQLLAERQAAGADPATAEEEPQQDDR